MFDRFRICTALKRVLLVTLLFLGSEHRTFVKFQTMIRNFPREDFIIAGIISLEKWVLYCERMVLFNYSFIDSVCDPLIALIACVIAFNHACKS